MSEEPKSFSLSTNVAEFLQLFGPPPVLTSENLRAYEAVLGKLLECLLPQDFMEQILILEVADSTWEAKRIGRHKTVSMECRVNDRRKYQALRRKAAEESKEASGSNQPSGQNGKASTDPEDVLEGLAEEIDAMVLKPAAEIDHARALEVGIAYYERLNKEQVIALARRDKALEQLDQYRARTLREVSDKIIEGNDVEGQSKQVDAPAITSGE